MNECLTCGCDPCHCHQKSDGYECSECGYTPTWGELQRGWCPQCREENELHGTLREKEPTQ